MSGKKNSKMKSQAEDLVFKSLHKPSQICKSRMCVGRIFRLNCALKSADSCQLMFNDITTMIHAIKSKSKTNYKTKRKQKIIQRLI